MERCLRSLQMQSFGEFQAILVENGSTDASADLCRKFAQEDSRFVPVFMPANCGPSGARNAGLERATGDYITFVDSDDFVVPDYFAQLKAAFEREQAEVVFFGYHQYAMDGTDLGEQLPAPVEHLAELHAQGLFGYTWIKAFRRETIGGHRFSETLNLLEDEVFACQVLASPRKICILSRALYCYITGNAGSLIGRTHGDFCRKMEAAYEAWRPLLTEKQQTQQANGRVRQCMYYGLERDLDAEVFFRDLAETSYFRECDSKDKFCERVRKGQWAALKRMRRYYRLKTALAKWLRR